MSEIDHADAKIVVEVLSVAAAQHAEIPMSSQAQVGVLRLEVSRACDLPPQALQLILYDKALEDHEYLHSHCRGGLPSLTVTMVVSVDASALERQFGSQGSSEVRSALGYVSRLGGKYGSNFMVAVLGCLGHPERDVRVDAIKALAEIAEKGDQEATTALITCVQDESEAVRSAALKALAKLAEQGDQRIIAVTIAMVADLDPGVRWDAVRTLARISQRGDEQVVTTLLGLLENTDSQVNRVAVEALDAVAEKGDQRVIDAAAAVIQSWY